MKAKNKKDLLAQTADLDYLSQLTSEPHNYQDKVTALLTYLVKQQINPAMAKYQSVISQAKQFIDKKNFSDPNIFVEMSLQKKST